jgi:acetaldehyde dehydrogenase (acetylating)
MVSDPDLVSIQEVREKVEQAYSAWTRYRGFTQQQIDAIVEAVAAEARAHAQRLAELAVQETGYGNARDKLAKNMLAAETLPDRMRGMRTLGILRELPEEGIVEIGEPMGVVAAVLPTTNPTSTAIYKTLIALKAGDAIVLSPHPRARACTCETSAILASAAEKAGAPAGTVGCVGASTIEGTNELMRHRRTAVILSTGGSGIVRAAYSSGKPAYGVGPGNVPVLIDTSADLAQAVAGAIQGTTFDYGTLCSSEQTVVAEKSLRDRILAEFKSRKAVLCDAAQAQALEKVLIGRNFSINPDCVGQPASKIAAKAGFQVPDDTTVLVVEIQGIGKEHPLSAEKLSPVLALHFVDSFGAALDACEAVLRFGGLGHTCGIYAKDDAHIREYAFRMPAYRVVANTPTPLGSTGVTTNVFPAMTLGCGAVAGNSTSDNISPLHLINIKRLAYANAAMPTRMTPTPPSGPAPTRTQIIDAVERFLAQRGADVPLPTSAPAPAAPPPEPTPALPPEPQIDVVDFVCEDDVRRAVRESRKIFIGPRTIVTPSARDFANANDVLVMTKGTSKKTGAAKADSE